MMTGALHDPFGIGHMGITAENIAADYQISREDMDAFAAQSQSRAAHADAAWIFYQPDHHNRADPAPQDCGF
jgi:acetyl-CoA C-acetyltransferase